MNVDPSEIFQYIGYNSLMGVKIIICLGVIMMAGCMQRQTNLERLQGHWHVISQHSDLTYDIRDSFVEVNKYSFADSWGGYNILIKGDSILLPVPCHHLAAMEMYSRYSLSGSGDSLIIYSAPECFQFDDSLLLIRMDERDCKWRDALASSNVNVDPPNGSDEGFIIADSLNTSLTAHIFIGKAKDTIFGESVRINVWDVFISQNELIPYFRQLFTMIERQDKIAVCLNYDRNVSKAFLYSVVKNMPLDSISKIYSLVSLPGEIKLAYQEFSPEKEFPGDSIPYYESQLGVLYNSSEKLYSSDSQMILSD